MQEKLIENLKTTFKNHRIENYGDINFLFFNFDKKNLCLKYSNDFQIKTLIKQNENGQYTEEIKVNWSDDKEFLGTETNSLLPKSFQSNLSIEEFLKLIN